MYTFEDISCEEPVEMTEDEYQYWNEYMEEKMIEEVNSEILALLAA